VAMVLQYLTNFSCTSPVSSLEALAEESIQKKEKAEKTVFANFYFCQGSYQLFFCQNSAKDASHCQKC
jgi:hypothetical protein